MHKSRAFLVFLIVVGIAASLLGQLYLVYRRPLWRDGVLLWAVAIVATVMAVRVSRQPVRAARVASRSVLQGIPGLRVVSVIGSMVLVAITSMWAVRRGTDRDFSDLFFVWLVGVLWYIAAFLRFSNVACIDDTTRQKRARRWTVLGLLCLLVAAAFVRIYKLGTIPINLGGD
ncbi:MAG: hypothetical protein MUQ10_17880, partial [Anaerolineae bacterium]|nr:hypothetical protein [Anaerolineae bacterium]